MAVQIYKQSNISRYIGIRKREMRYRLQVTTDLLSALRLDVVIGFFGSIIYIFFSENSIL